MPRYFDKDLPRVGADKLKPMVKIWGGNPKMIKNECIHFIIAALKDPARVQAAVANLEPWERNALALIKRAGGIIQSSALKIGILMSGLHPRRTYKRREDFIEDLLRRGLLLVMDPYGPGSFFERYDGDMLYTDERILAQVGSPECLALEIQSIPAPEEIHYRHSAAVTLDMMGMLQTIENMGGLKLTQTGSVRVNDEAKLRKAMRWGEEGVEFDGFLFPNPIQAWLSAFRHAGLLQQTDEGQLVLKESTERIAQRPFGEQVLQLMEGLIRTSSWWEIHMEKRYRDMNGNGRRQGRTMLTLALPALPTDPGLFFSVEDFEKCIYQRIGEDFSLDRAPERPWSYGLTPEQERQKISGWQVQTRTKWLMQEYPWIIGALTTWLYFLGLVELGMQGGELVGFRLSDVGRAVFHPEFAAAVQTESNLPTSSQAVWVVQPNFDIIAYLDRIDAPQLAFLERHAERTQSQRYTAQYRLTRESVYRGLESGTTISDLLARMESGSQVALPQNVLVELREWAALRERMILRRSTSIMEFPSAQALQSQLAQGLRGQVIAERFLLLDQQANPELSNLTSINYAHPLAKNLKVTETGMISVKHGIHDLLTAAQLNQWAIPQQDEQWQLTANSVSLALKPGRKISQLLVWLNSRLSHRIPPLLEVALRSWAGESYQVELEDAAIILHCHEDLVFRAISESPMLKPLLKGYLPPNLLFVRPEHLQALREHLDWLGWQVSDELKIYRS